jgi:hypothetical protein
VLRFLKQAASLLCYKALFGAVFGTSKSMSSNGVRYLGDLQQRHLIKDCNGLYLALAHCGLWIGVQFCYC